MFHAFSVDCLNGSTAHATERLTHTVVQGSCLLKVMGQEILSISTFRSFRVRVRDASAYDTSFCLCQMYLLCHSCPHGLTLRWWGSLVRWCLEPGQPQRIASGLSRGGDVAVNVFDMNQPNLPAPFYSILVSVFVCMVL